MKYIACLNGRFSIDVMTTEYPTTIIPIKVITNIANTPINM